ncbi:MAG: hypothetical protein JRG84_20225 [Deltaproteobacteria bacterium]|nr:hypothetical protein [Deltaproteobacteria bacterium]
MKRGSGPGWRGLALIAVFAAAAADAQGAALWPSEPWVALTVGGADYWDVLGDENPEATDLVGGIDDGISYSALVGGIDDGISYSAGAWHESTTNDQLSLRMRLDADGSTSNSVWQFMFNTDTDPDVDWVLEVRQSGSPGGQQVIFTAASPGGPLFDDIALDPAYDWTGPLADWRRWIPVTDGSTFDGDPDYFLDTAIPLSTFHAITGLNQGDSYSIALSSSTSHTQVNKDIPLGLNDTDPVSSAFADLLYDAPEPGTAGLSAMGLCWLAVLRSRARRRARCRSGA